MMKKFLFRVVGGTLPLLALLLGLEVALRSLPNDYSYKAEWLKEHAREVEVLVVGSSHGLYGIDPEAFSRSAFNAAHVSQSFRYDAHILGRYADCLTALKWVVVPLSYGSLFSELEESPERWRIRNYTIHYKASFHRWEWEYATELSNLSMDSFRWLERWAFRGENHRTTTPQGFGTLCHLANRLPDWEQTGRAAAERHTEPRGKTAAPRESCVADLDRLIDLCETHGWQLLLVTTPTWHTYYEALNPEQWAATRTHGEALAQRYAHVHYLNLLCDENFSADEFYDADHLNELGARHLTGLIEDFMHSVDPPLSPLTPCQL